MFLVSAKIARRDLREKVNCVLLLNNSSRSVTNQKLAVTKVLNLYSSFADSDQPTDIFCSLQEWRAEVCVKESIVLNRSSLLLCKNSAAESVCKTQLCYNFQAVLFALPCHKSKCILKTRVWVRALIEMLA